MFLELKVECNVCWNVILLYLLIICYEREQRTKRVNNDITIKDDDNLGTKVLATISHTGTQTHKQ